MLGLGFPVTVLARARRGDRINDASEHLVCCGALGCDLALNGADFRLGHNWAFNPLDVHSAPPTGGAFSVGTQSGPRAVLSPPLLLLLLLRCQAGATNPAPGVRVQSPTSRGSSGRISP